MKKEITKEELLNIERNIGKILRVGVVISTAVIVIGLLMFIITTQSGYPDGAWPDTLASIWQGFTQLKPLAWLMTGLLLLILTPVLRVVASIFAFAKEGDKLYVGITTIVLLILLIAIGIGHG